jgi:1-aminocyclopropane-1-carboxylate deaminase/D-cysteine desulfhydrase-like pyridoxal-dependent ACC family enzyme
MLSKFARCKLTFGPTPIEPLPRLTAHLGSEAEILIVADDVILMKDYAYPLYGAPSKETIDAIRLSARLEAMITDPVYEGRA